MVGRNWFFEFGGSMLPVRLLNTISKFEKVDAFNDICRNINGSIQQTYR